MDVRVEEDLAQTDGAQEPGQGNQVNPQVAACGHDQAHQCQWLAGKCTDREGGSDGCHRGKGGDHTGSGVCRKVIFLFLSRYVLLVKKSRPPRQDQGGRDGADGISSGFG